MNSISSYSEAMFNYTQSLNSTFPQLPLQIDDAGGDDERGRSQQFAEPLIDLLVEERMRVGFLIFSYFKVFLKKLELHVRELQNRLQAEKKLENRQNV